MKLESAAFTDDGEIPKKYSCQGKNVSPPLTWSDVPDGTRSFALIVDDPDAPTGTFTHWTVYDLPPELRGLPEDIPQDPTAPHGAKQGKNSYARTGYDGPCPPNGPYHTYHFKLYALNHPLGLHGGATKAQIEAALGEDRVIEMAELRGRFKKAGLVPFVKSMMHH